MCSVLNNKSSQCCHICGASISEMNKLDSLWKRKINQSALSYGIPVLHGKIRFLECVMHVSYRLELRKWRVSRVTSKLYINFKRILMILYLKKWWICYGIILFRIWLVGVMGCYIDANSSVILEKLWFFHNFIVIKDTFINFQFILFLIKYPSTKRISSDYERKKKKRFKSFFIKNLA